MNLLRHLTKIQAFLRGAGESGLTIHGPPPRIGRWFTLNGWRRDRDKFEGEFRIDVAAAGLAHDPLAATIEEQLHIMGGGAKATLDPKLFSRDRRDGQGTYTEADGSRCAPRPAVLSRP